MVNVEAGYGTSDRWLGRLFSMVYTSKLRLTLLGNANNLNDERRPSQNGSWSPDKLQAGDKTTLRGGFDYYYDNSEKAYSVNGIVDITHADFNNLTSRNITTFLPSGNRYGFDFQNQKNNGMTINTWHNFYMEKAQWLIDIYANYDYGKSHSKENLSSAEFTDDVQGVSESTIKNLYSGNSTWISDIVNRVLSSDYIDSHSSKASLSGRYKYKFLKYGSDIRLTLKNEYESRHADRSQDYLLNIGADSKPADRLVRDFHNHPDHRNTLDGTLEWAKRLNGNLWWYETYKYKNEQTNSTSEVWMLADAMTSQDYVSASMRENMPTMVPDYTSGFRSKETDNIHELNTKFDFDKDKWFFQLQLPVRVAERKLWYTRSHMEANPKSTDVTLNPKFWIMYFINQKTRKRILFSFDMQEYLCDMVNLVDIPNTTDPLNIFIGNPNLKNIIRHDISLSGNYSIRKTNHDFQASYTFWRNAIARGFNYDPATGVRTYTPMNINGNNEWHASYSLDLSFGHMDRFSFSNTLEYRRLTNFDFVSEDEIEMTKSRVRTLRFSDRPKLSYGFGSNKVTLFGDLSIAHYTGSLQSFRTFNAGDINYGVSGTFKLPCNFGITTDFTIYMRRGYNDQALNTNNYVWNARLSYSIPKAHLLFMVDGWDLLHDIKNVSYAVNAQGRTETYTTILPRYVMLHIQWNFNKQPKKR